MPDDRTLMHQALHALEYHRQQTRPIQQTDEAINALRARLGRLAAPQAQAEMPPLVEDKWQDVHDEMQRFADAARHGWSPQSGRPTLEEAAHDMEIVIERYGEACARAALAKGEPT